MENNRNSGWRESIWSIPRPFVFAYFMLVTLLGLPTVVVIVWEKAQAVDAHWWAWHTEVIRAAAPECGWTGIGIAFSALVTVQGVAILMVGYRYAIERWVKPIGEKRRAEAREKGREEGRTEGREEGRTEGREEGRTEGREEGRTEGREEGRTEGREEGRTEAYRQWEEWLQRKTEAESKGLTFDEPPPGAAQQ